MFEKEAEEYSFRYTLDKPWVCEVERKQIMAHFEKGYLAGAEPREKRIAELEKENAILKKALNLYVNWADECGVAWDNFPDMKEKWSKTVEEKGLGWIDGLIFMVTEEAKEQLKKEK